MPELPDVEVVKRYVEARALHQRIERVAVRHAGALDNLSPRQLEARVKGRELRAARRHGKHLFIEVEGDGWLTMHFGMTGYPRWLSAAEPEAPHDRVIFALSDGGRLAYNNRRLLGRIGMVDSPEAEVTARGLGPDALDLDLAGFRGALAGKKGNLKAALMDQTTIAGIGNIYSDEILFQARVHPRAALDELDDARLKAVFQAMKKVLDRAIAADADPEKMPRGFLLPQRRAGGKCPGCGGEIARLKLAGRSSYHCPSCQH